LKKLEGGLINQVYLDGGIVIKTFGNDNLVGVSSSRRIRNESDALMIFGGTIAPHLISYKGNVLWQEFIEGEIYESRARRGERVFESAGRVLAEIHNARIISDISPNHYLARFRRAVLGAIPILNLENLSPQFEVSPDIVREWSVRYIHGDFWLGNLIGKDEERPKAIDWEFSGTGSPFEDFAIVELWIFREFLDSDIDFWRGYGRKPDQETINSFLILRCVEFLATATIEQYLLEESDGFYHNKVKVLKSLLR
jgi:tRNA A-37 threonylcarbamoyl transferase component Bud32